MAKAFSVASWNVEHFGKTSKNSSSPEKPVGPIIQYLADQNADVVAVSEVVGKEVFQEVIDKMSGYQFHITEGVQAQEILVGVKKKFTSFFTQKTEFKSGEAYLRPGALLTLHIDGEIYPILFLHLKSSSTPKGFGLRDDMTQRAIKFKKELDKNHKSQGKPGKSNFIFLGDLNTMGMNLSYSPKDVAAIEEIERLKKRLGISSVKMRILDKTVEETWWPGSNGSYDIGNLDHVVAAEHLEFKKFAGAPVETRGWVEKSTPSQKDTWAETYSDHALLYFEVQKV